MDETSDTSIGALLAHCGGFPLQSFAPGEALIAEGPATGRMYVLVSGAVEILRGQTQISEIAAPGATFGDIAALLGTGHTATVRAITPVVAHRIDDARAALLANTEITYFVASFLARRLMDVTAYLADVKAQFAGRSDHLGMVDEVLDTLLQRQGPSVAVGSSLTDDPRL
jgi:CRP/FNR family cyclic AMP-dependent transcriptional regulator